MTDHDTADPNPPRENANPTPAERPPWFVDGLRFECTQCGNCCRSNGEYEHLYLTSSDVLALAGELQLAEIEFREQYTEALDGWTVLKNDGESCRFLDSQGRCSVYAGRPMQCRTWPFWKENLEKKVWEGPVRTICPGLDKGPLHSAAQIQRTAQRNEDWYASDGFAD